MPPGKLAAQAGHAYTDALYNTDNVDRFYQYRNAELGGSKVTLQARNESQLIKLYNDLIAEGISCAIVVDREHVLLPHFDGSPVITAVGIGPCKQSEVRHLTKKFQCV